MSGKGRTAAVGRLIRIRSAENTDISRTGGHITHMMRLQLLKKEAMSLADAERAVLASDLLQTLLVVLSDEDEGLAEALRRDAELDADSPDGIEWKDLRKELGR